MPGTFHNGWFQTAALRPWTKKLLPLKDQPLSWCELGVFQGQSACWALENILLHPHSHMWLVDCWLPTRKIPAEDMEKNYQLALENLKPHIEAGRVTIYRDKSQDRLPRFPDKLFDVLYIDAGHDYDDVKADTELGWPKVKPGGLILYDDYRALRKSDGVTRVVNRYYFGVDNETGEIHEPIYDTKPFYETSRQQALYKTIQPGDSNVSGISDYCLANLHTSPIQGPYVYARPGNQSSA